DVGKIVDEAIKNSLPSVQASMAAVNEAIARETPAAAASAKPEMAISGHRIEIPVKKDGKIVGKANAMLNMDRTLHSVLALARRDQGEIRFALDQKGKIYNPD